MSYSIHIGNAKPEFSKEDGLLMAGWSVERVAHADAPTFPNDDMTGNGNGRHPSYSGWVEFCDKAGLKGLFFDADDGLMREHPGCFPITDKHLLVVRGALARARALATKPPGFDGYGRFDKETKQWSESTDVGKYDPILARLIWLEYWMAWAIANCETPALENT